VTFKITVTVDATAEDLPGIREDLAAYCEGYGDVRRVSVTEVRPEQMRVRGV
jgi:hypothetical protein